ncbi:hypothetical protein ACFFJD_02285 [Gordonia phosphorivorans]|uniref:Uncharacterized protein n=1 Tax=Gordonia phosphorivorans TaxID=1056982 RepID=A0ABV6H487_9ACTN
MEELSASRRAFVEAEADQVWSRLNGTVAEGVFLQMVARIGMEVIAKDPKLRAEMWNHVPPSARGYRP